MRDSESEVVGVQSANGDSDRFLSEVLASPPAEPWPEAVDGAQLLEELRQTVSRFVVLPKWAPEALALWVVHTYAFTYRDITTYLGIESPEHRCGKSTLLTVLSELSHRAVVASNVTAPSFFRVIAQVQPTLFIDEADTFLKGNEELKGILNSSYLRKTAFVLRAINMPSPNPGPVPGPGPRSDGASRNRNGGVRNGEAGRDGGNDGVEPAAGNGTAGYHPGIFRFSCWCPKVVAKIGSLPVTLADRCVVFRLQRKTPTEQCERLRKFDPLELKRKCLRFALDHAEEIGSAEPAIPQELNDRAADIWEPLLVIADLAGGPWPEMARNAAVGVSATAADSNLISGLLFDIYLQFAITGSERMFSSALVERLNGMSNRPWQDLQRGKPVDDRWLARQLSPYGVRPRNVRIEGKQAKGYEEEEILDLVKRYVSKHEAKRMLGELRHEGAEGQTEPEKGGALLAGVETPPTENGFSRKEAQKA